MYFYSSNRKSVQIYFLQDKYVCMVIMPIVLTCDSLSLSLSQLPFLEFYRIKDILTIDEVIWQMHYKV